MKYKINIQTLKNIKNHTPHLHFYLKKQSFWINKKKKLVFLKSPFIYKKFQEHYCINLFKNTINIIPKQLFSPKFFEIFIINFYFSNIFLFSIKKKELLKT